MYFSDRTDAGRRLAARLHHLKGQDLVVVGLPRGGVPVAAQVAEALGAPLDVCLVRKLGVPFQPELAMGAIGEEGVRVINEEVVRATGVTDRDLAAVEEHERGVLEQRARRYRGEQRPARYEGRTVLVVDDGLATGSTALAACRIARARGASRIVLAVPVAPHDWSARVGGAADEGVCVHTPGCSTRSVSSTRTSSRRATRRSSPAWSTTARRTPRPTRRRLRAAPLRSALLRLTTGRSGYRPRAPRSTGG